MGNTHLGRMQNNTTKKPMSKQTAVEWLIFQLNKQGFAKVVTDEEIEQAKAMEKEQMKEMYLKGIENYDPTFKRNI